MRITDIQIRKTGGKSALQAVVSITIYNSFAIHDIKIISTEKGLLVVMPNKQGRDGKYRDIAHPVSVRARTYVEKKVLEAYRLLLEEAPLLEVAASVEG